MRSVLALLGVVALALASTAAAKSGDSVLVIGPTGPTLVEPYPWIGPALGVIAPAAVPPEPYVLVYPLVRGVPARPGHWYPQSGTLCTGWRTGAEAGCATAARLRGSLGSGIATGLFTEDPARIVALARGATVWPRYGKRATAIELALNQRPLPAPQPPGCVRYTARWTGPQAAARPTSFCVTPVGGLFAGGSVYPLEPATARFLIG